MAGNDPMKAAAAFRNTLDKLVEDKAALVARLTGDLFFDIGGTAFTLRPSSAEVIDGPKSGDVAFELVADAEVFLSLIDPSLEVDLDRAEQEGRFSMQGDFAQFERVLRYITGDPGRRKHRVDR